MSSFVADESLDAQAFHQAATRFARSKGCRDEDVPSQMLLYALEARERRPGLVLSLELCWRRAYEVLHPRGSDGVGGRVRRDAMDHSVGDFLAGPGGDEMRITECTVVDFGSQYTAVVATKSLTSQARLATADLRRARYLARFKFGHLPFVL